MIRRATFFTLVLFLFSPYAASQRLSEQRTAGYNDERTFFNSQVDGIEAPLELQATIELPSGPPAESFLVSEDYFLLGGGGQEATFTLVERPSGLIRWQHSLQGAEGPFDYVPAISHDIVLLGGPATTTVKAVRISDGMELWRDTGVGGTRGRHPVLTRHSAFYHGAFGVAAADPSSGQVFWQLPSTSMNNVVTAAAPLVFSEEAVFLIDSDGSLLSLDSRTGEEIWVRALSGGDESQMIAVRDLVFVLNRSTEEVSALHSADGTLLWSRPLRGAASPAMTLAFGKLFLFSEEEESLQVQAVDASSGDPLWNRQLESGAPRFGQVAGRSLLFYDPLNQRVHLLDVENGITHWTIPTGQVQDMAVVGEKLYLLQDGIIQVYARSHRVFLAHLADGGGATTLITLVNQGESLANVTVDFFDSNASPLPLMIEGGESPLSTVLLAINPGGAARIQTAGASPLPNSGWAVARSDRPLTGTSIFQFVDGGRILFEAGVDASRPTTSARLYVTRELIGEDRFSTGVAIANPSQEAAHVRLTFLRTPETGLLLPEGISTEISLESGEHLARFIEQLFPEFIDFGTEGALIIHSDIPIIATGLRTRNGLQMSSYPLGIP